MNATLSLLARTDTRVVALALLALTGCRVQQTPPPESPPPRIEETDERRIATGPPLSAPAALPPSEKPNGPSPTATPLPAQNAPPQTYPTPRGHNATGSCNTKGKASVFTRAMDARLPELSGLVDSKNNGGILWTHNDSGDGARIYALSSAGLRAVYELNDVQAEDFEDIALVPQERGTDALVIADTGDNFRKRDHVTLYRVAEPQFTQPPSATQETTLQAAVQHVRYPEGATDVEAVLVDPRSGDVVLLAKGMVGDNDVFLVRKPAFTGGTTTAERVGKVELGFITAADISRDGSRILVRTYNNAFLFERGPGESVPDALRRKPCTLPVRDEPQGESIAVSADGERFFTVSEGRGQPVLMYPLPPRQ